MNWKKKKVLVTGSEGFIGSHLVERLISNGSSVKAFVLYNSFNSWGWLDTFPKDKIKKIEICMGDVRDYNSVYSAMKEADVVFHLAALIGIPFSYYAQDSYIDTNIRGTINVLQAARNLRNEKIVHTSTSEIYGTAQYVPIDEKHPVNPQSPYAATKASADHLALSFHKSFNLPVTVLRPFNTFGPRQSARAVIPTVISQVLSGRKAVKLGNLKATRDFNYVSNVVDAFIKLAETEGVEGDIFNAGSGRDISISQLVEIVGKIAGKKINVIEDRERLRPEKSEVMQLLCDCGKLKKVSGWEPTVSLEKGIELTFSWIKDNFSKYKPDIYNL
jgi:dTDP-glucose 4,6-dehydratase